MFKRFALAAWLVCSAASVASAGDGIMSPEVNGKTTWSTNGVINNGNVGTAFSCTATQAATVTVEVYNHNGDLEGTPIPLAIPLGNTRTWTTQLLPLTGANNMTSGPGSFQGSARFAVSTGTVQCTAYLMDLAGNLIASLPIHKKVKQKGQ